MCSSYSAVLSSTYDTAAISACASRLDGFTSSARFKAARASSRRESEASVARINCAGTEEALISSAFFARPTASGGFSSRIARAIPIIAGTQRASSFSAAWNDLSASALHVWQRPSTNISPHAVWMATSRGAAVAASR